MNYTPKRQTSLLTLDNIIANANAYIDTLSVNEQHRLKEQLKHGTNNITTIKQLKMYLKCYGEIHKAKLMKCYNNIPHNIWSEEFISIIDYDSGQGLAEIVLAEFLNHKWIDNDLIKDITLIEPSRISLIQSIEYLSKIFINSSILPILKSDYQINSNDLNPKSNTIIHILSNIIDLNTFKGNNIISLLNEDNEHNNIVVCVSPYYQETRGKKSMNSEKNY